MNILAMKYGPSEAYLTFYLNFAFYFTQHATSLANAIALACMYMQWLKLSDSPLYLSVQFEISLSNLPQTDNKVRLDYI